MSFLVFSIQKESSGLRSSPMSKSVGMDGDGRLKRQTKMTRLPSARFTCLVLGLGLLTSCVSLPPGASTIRPPNRPPDRELTLETTGYCRCQECTGWKRNWLGRPVYSSGPLRGRPKAVGITASGARARRGTIAADTKLFPFGTILYIPDYGYGRVEDRGGAIRGKHVDLYFSQHSGALRWGRVTKRVKVWWAAGGR